MTEVFQMAMPGALSTVPKRRRYALAAQVCVRSLIGRLSAELMRHQIEDWKERGVSSDHIAVWCCAVPGVEDTANPGKRFTEIALIGRAIPTIGWG